jgi:hypothetical protein
LSITAPCPIKVTTTPSSIPNGSRANETTSKNSKTGKVTAVVAGMMVFCKNKCSLLNTNQEKGSEKSDLAPNLKKLV